MPDLGFQPLAQPFVQDRLALLGRRIRSQKQYDAVGFERDAVLFLLCSDFERKRLPEESDRFAGNKLSRFIRVAISTSKPL